MVVLLAGEALFLGRRDDFAIDDQRRGRVVVERRDAQNASVIHTVRRPGRQAGLFPFDRAGWLGADVVDDAVDAAHAVDHAGRDPRRTSYGKGYQSAVMKSAV